MSSIDQKSINLGEKEWSAAWQLLLNSPFECITSSLGQMRLLCLQAKRMNLHSQSITLSNNCTACVVSYRHCHSTQILHRDFAGPCVGMDTACSSSLVATHLAHRGLLDGETSCAISAGVNLMLVASTSTNLAALGALSSNGRSKTFEATADGYGRGEGCIVVAMRLAGGATSAYCHAILQGNFKLFDL